MTDVPRTGSPEPRAASAAVSIPTLWSDSELETALDEQLDAWQRGRPVSVEALVARRSGRPWDDEAVLDLIYHEAVLRESVGEAPSADDYTPRFPHLADALRRQFAVHSALGPLERCLGGSSGVDALPSAAVETLPSGASTRPQPLHEVGRFEILDELGRGGAGVVYRARDRLLTGRTVALKVMRSGGQASAEDRERFLAEARAVAALVHPQIVPLYECGIQESAGGTGTLYAVFEYLPGGSLAHRLAGVPLAPRDAASLLASIAEAVEYAHSRGVIHRDLKPANILLDRPAASNADGSRLLPGTIVKVIDFGLCKLVDDEVGPTRTGTVLGTPAYMPPEQARGESRRVGPTVDVYSLGAVLYEMLTGRPPFRADTVLGTLQQVMDHEPVPPRLLTPGTPRDLETICLKCLQKRPDDRYQTAQELADDVRRFLEGRPILARPVPWWIRSASWMRRHRTVSALMGTIAVVAVAAVVVWVRFTTQLQSSELYARQQESLARQRLEDVARERDEARRLRREADEQAKVARRQSQRAAEILRLTIAELGKITTASRSGSASAGGAPDTAGRVLYNVARSFARASAALSEPSDGDPTTLEADDRTKLAEQYAAGAARLLTCAQKEGYFARPEQRQQLAADADFARLRERLDFAALRLLIESEPEEQEHPPP